MNARRLEHFEALLQRERQRIVSILEHVMATPGAAADAPPGDDAAAGALGTTPEDDDAVVARERIALRDVDRALRLIRESPHDYGICARCGRPIPDERLELLPATRACGRSSPPA
jgi:DnaK suppressor protein